MPGRSITTMDEHRSASAARGAEHYHYRLLEPHHPLTNVNAPIDFGKIPSGRKGICHLWKFLQE